MNLSLFVCLIIYISSTLASPAGYGTEVPSYPSYGSRRPQQESAPAIPATLPAADPASTSPVSPTTIPTTFSMSATSSPLPTVTRSATSRSPTSTSTSSGAGLATQTPGGDDDSLFPGFGDFLSGAGGGLPSGGSSNLPSTGAGLGSSNSTATKASVTVGIGIGVAIAAVAAAFGLYVMVKKLRAKPEEDSLEEAKSTRNSMLSTEPVIPSKEFTVLTADRPMSILPAPVALPSTPMPSDPIGTATVRNIYSPRDDDEVTVQIGDSIEIFRRYDDGWVYGRNTRTNQSGVLPEMIL